VYLSIGVTGHRDLLEAETPGLESQVRAFFQSLAKRFPRLELQLLCPMAEGGDQLAARIALELGIGLVAVLPMARDEYEQDFRSPASLQEFRDLLASARQVICLPGAPGSETVDFGGSVASRDRQYAQAGLFISDHCQILLAIWDGKTHEAVGGTAQVVRYHLTAVIEGLPRFEGRSSLRTWVFHILANRARTRRAREGRSIPFTAMASAPAAHSSLTTATMS